MRLVVWVSVVLVLAGRPAPRQDAESVLAGMRKALGGDAALDAIHGFSASGSIAKHHDGFHKNLSLQLHALLPDHFLTIENDRDSAGPMNIDITYYRGFRGDTLIRRTDSTIPFPPDPGPQTPAAIAQREAEWLLTRKQEFTRLALVLFGKAFDAYPLTLSYEGRETVDGQAMDAIDGKAADGFVTRLYVDAATALPAIVAWKAPPGVMVSTSSTAIMRGGQMISQTPPGPLPSVDPPAGAPLLTWRLVPSEFKAQNGVNWPRRLKVMIGKDVVEEMRLGKLTLNPKLDPRKFVVGR